MLRPYLAQAAPLMAPLAAQLTSALNVNFRLPRQ